VQTATSSLWWERFLERARLDTNGSVGAIDGDSGEDGNVVSCLPHA